MKKISCLLLIYTLLFSLTVNGAELCFIHDEGIAGVAESYLTARGLMQIWKNGESAIINKYGEIIMDFDSQQKKLAPNGLIAILGENNKIGFADQKGNMITEFVYDAFIDTHEKTGNTVVGYLAHMYLRGDGSSDFIPVSKDGKFGYINSYGTVVIPFKYDYAYGFKGGIARICAEGELSNYGTYINGKYGYIKEDGTELLPADSYWIGQDFNLSLGYAEASNGGSHRVLIDKNGTVATCDEKGYADIDVSYIVFNPSAGVYGVYGKDGEVVIPAEESEPITVKDNRFVVANTIRNEKNEILYTAPENSTLFFQLGYDELIFIGYASNGNFGERKYGCVTWDGAELFAPEYDSISLIGDGLLKLRKGGEYILASAYGRVIYRSPLNPCVAYDGFISFYDSNSMLFKIAFNPLERPAVYLDNKRINFTDAYPFFEEERTMIPLRSVFEDVGATVNWDSVTGLISVIRNDVTVSMKIGDKNINIGDKVYVTDTAPIAVDNRTYIPLRVFSEGIGMKIRWDGETNSVYLEN